MFLRLLVYIIMLVLVFYLCPSSVRDVATFSGTVLFSLLCCTKKLISFLYFLILFSHQLLGFPSGQLPSASPTKTMSVSLLSTVMCHTPSPLQSVLLIRRADREVHRPVSCYLLPLRSKFIHRRRNLEDPQPILFCQCRAQV